MPLIDVAVVVASALLMSWLNPLLHPVSLKIWPWSNVASGAVVLACLFSPLVLQRLGLYRSWRGQGVLIELARLLLAGAVVVVLVATVGVATRSNYLVSRVWFFSTMATTVLGWCGYRAVLRWALAVVRARGGDIKRVYLIGWGDTVQQVVRSVRVQPGAGYEVVGFFTDTRARERPEVSAPFMGDLESLCRRLSHAATRVDQVWVALPEGDASGLKDIYTRLLPTFVEVRYVLGMAGLALSRTRVSQVGGLPLMHLTESPMSGSNRFVKAIEDRVLALFLLVLVSPVMLLVAAAVKLTSPGPILFRQRRHGWNGEVIWVWKFRTMYVHAESAVYEQARRKDPRITPLGRWLRRLSLDELPQFFNVLQGRMSVVGPRPHPIQMSDQYRDLVNGYMMRHGVKPGITGWAQVNGYRGETETIDLMRMRVQHDLYYIEKWSIWFDLLIVAMTAVQSVFSKRAY